MTYGQDVIDGLKGCTRCRKMLPLEAFAPKPHLYSGLDSWCRACRAEDLREWRAKRLRDLSILPKGSLASQRNAAA